MPHTWASSSAIDKSLPHQAIVIWFTEKWASEIADLCPEYAPISLLLRNSRRALSFGPAEAEQVLQTVPDLLSDFSLRRLHGVLAILTALATAEGNPLGSLTKTERVNKAGWPQLDRVLDALHKRYSEPIRIEELCAIGNMSPRTLHRMFMSRLGENVSDYLRKLRVGHACMLLVETDLPISVISARAGFFSTSNFNRSFLRTRQTTPLELRRFVRQHGQMPKLSSEIETADSERSFILQRDKLRQLQV
jgi:AraC-like DNA-binding protein